MINNKKDFIFRAIALQTSICLMLFGILYLLKKNNIGFFSEIEKNFSKSLSENITVDEVEDVFNNLFFNQLFFHLCFYFSSKVVVSLFQAFAHFKASETFDRKSFAHFITITLNEFFNG